MVGIQLDSDTLLSIEDTKDKVATQQQLTDVRNQLAKIHEELEAILYNTDLAVGNGATQDKINEINNIILELDKSSLKLGSAVAKKVV
jgi:metallo-beta-lactamase family protein